MAAGRAIIVDAPDNHVRYRLIRRAERAETVFLESSEALERVIGIELPC